MPVFNRERMVDEAIRSVVDQDFHDFELLIVDDGSTDGTPEVLRRWQERDPRIVVVTAPQNLGIPGALNLGLAHARGPYVARHDSDDLMMPRRLAAQVAVLDAHPEVALVSTDYDIVDLEGQLLRTWTNGEPPEVTAFLLNFYNVIGGHGQVMFRRDQVRAEGGYSFDYPSSEDYDLWVRLLRRGRVEILPFVGMVKRTHPDQSMARWGHLKRANWTGILRSSLQPYLGRTLLDDEIAALITLWHYDGTPGLAGVADRVMGEAFARFQRDHAEPSLHLWARRKIARRWYRSGRMFAFEGQRLEAARYLVQAAKWLVSP